MQINTRTSTDINAGAIVTAALDDDISRVDGYAGASAVSARTLDTRKTIKLKDLIDMYEAFAFIFAMEQLMIPSDPKAEDDRDSQDEQLSTRLPIELIKKVIFEHLYDFDASTELSAMQALKYTNYGMHTRYFDKKYTTNPRKMFRRIEDDCGKKPSQIIIDPDLPSQGMTALAAYIKKKQTQTTCRHILIIMAATLFGASFIGALLFLGFHIQSSAHENMGNSTNSDDPWNRPRSSSS